MTDKQGATVKIPGGVLARLGNPLGWSLADKILLIACLILPLTIWYLAVFHYLMAHPEVATYIDRKVLTITTHLQTGLVIAWFALIAICILCRRRFPDSTLLLHGLIVLVFWTILYFTYMIGPSSSVFLPSSMLMAMGVGFIMFDERIVFRWMVVAFIVLLSLLTLILTQPFEQVSYAPLLLDAPFKNGRLELSWVIGVEAVGLSIIPLTGTVFWLLTKNWRAREDQLATAKEQLTHANKLISRYLPNQVAQGVLDQKITEDLGIHRRKITVVFTDLKDFTDVSERLEPEDVARVLNEYLAEMTVIVDQHGGTLDQYQGDGILIYFGAPNPTNDKDHALHALRMARDMQSRIREMNEKWQNEVLEHPLEIRIGINTGYASIGNFGTKGRMTYTAIGRAVNLASRLETLCPPGDILISHSTWLLVRDEFPCEYQGEVEIKGVLLPVKTYRAKVETAAFIAPSAE